MWRMLAPAAVISGLLSPAFAAESLREFATGFEEATIPPDFEPCLRPENAIALTREKHRSGRQSLMLRIRPTPLFLSRLAPEILVLRPVSCEVADKLELYRNDHFERAELWENRVHSPNFGDEVWYGFSMLVDRDSAPAGDFNRVVLGQWKAQYDGPGVDYSPFLAQRLTGGFYHLTLDVDAKQKGRPEDAENPKQCKVLLAFAAGRPSELDEPLALDRPALCETRLENSRYELEPAEPLAIARAAYLPNPFDRWTDVVVGMRGGARGFVELWVDGVLIARATGRIGHRKARRDKQYFKFGPYRDTAAYPFIVYLDNLARGGTKEFVDPARR